MGLTGRTIIGGLGAAALVLGLAACDGGGAPEEGGTETTIATDGDASGGGRTEEEVLAAVQASFDEESLAGALARLDGVMLTERTPDWMEGYEVYQLDGILGSPRGSVVAIAADDSAFDLDSNPEAFSEISAQFPVADAAEAEERAADFLELTRSMFTWSYQIDSVDDVDWLGELSEESQEIADQFAEDWGDVVAPPTAAAEGDGWMVTVYRMEQDTGLEYTVTVAADGSVSEEHTTFVEGLPMPIGL